MPARILVIEDNRENLELMTYLLDASGFLTLTAADGVEGLKVLRRELPDLILCDLQMPRMDGYEVAREIRGDPRLAKLPLVAVTAYAMRGDRDRVLKAGFDGYISKPIVPEEFVSQIQLFVCSAPSASPPSRPVPAPVTPEMPAAQARATIVVVDNSPVNLNLMRSTLEPFHFKVITLDTVREALEMIRREPPDLIISDLHMPETDGYGFLGALKADPLLKAIPFMLLSSTVWRDTDPRLALSLGADKFVLRPIEPQELIAEIEACLVLGKAS